MKKVFLCDNELAAIANALTVAVEYWQGIEASNWQDGTTRGDTMHAIAYRERTIAAAALETIQDALERI